MVINSFHIDGFGLFSDSGIETLAPGLILVCAENGGGKTTLRDFFRAMLFGLPPRLGNKYPPFLPVLHGGKLDFTTQNGNQYHLARSFSPNRISLTTGDGQPVPDLAPVLSNTTLDIYKNIFAVGLPELQDAESLNSEQVKAMIGGAGSGHSGRALLVALKDLNGEMEERFKRSGQNPVINKLLTTLESDQAQQKRSIAESERYWEYENQREELKVEIESLRRKEKELRSNHAHFELLDKAWGDWISYQSLQRSLDEVQPYVAAFPDRGIEQLAANRKALSACVDEAHAVGAELDSKLARSEALVMREDILEQSVAIEAAHSGLALYGQNQQDVVRQREEVTRLARKISDGLKNLGQWNLQRLDQFDDGLVAMAEKAKVVDCLKIAQAKLLQIETSRLTINGDLTAAQTALHKEREIIAKRFPQPPPSHDWIEEKSNTLNLLRSRLAEQRGLQEVAADTQRQVKEAEERAEALQADLSHPQSQVSGVQNPPFRTWAWAALLAGLLLAALSFKTPLTAAIAALLGVVGFVFFWRAQSTTPSAVAPVSTPLERELADWRAKQTALVTKGQEQGARLQTIAAEIAAMGSGFNRPEVNEADCQRIQEQLHKQRGERREWDTLQAKVEDLQLRAEECERRVRDSGEQQARAEAEVATSRALWSGWLLSRQLDGAMLPETFEDVYRQIQQSRQDKFALDEARSLVERTEKMIADYREQVRAIFNALHTAFPPEDKVSTAIQDLVRQRELARQTKSDKMALDEAVVKLTADATRLAALAKRLESEYEGLLEQGGASSHEDFVSRATAWDEKCRLQTAIRSKLQNLETLSAPGEKQQQLMAELEATDRETLQAKLIESANLQHEAATELGTLIHRHGEVSQAMTALATGDEVAQLSQRVADEQGELQELAEEWAVRRLGNWLLERARAKFQEERQPAVLQNAGGYLSIISGGQYSRIVQPMGTDDYHLQRREGGIKDGRENWNTGLKEQTYLSLRMGLIDDFSTRAEPLPVILDDALVNFDPARLEGAIQSIHDFAQRHQVFYFTCHSNTLDLFSKAGKSVAAYSIREGRFARLELSAI